MNFNSRPFQTSTWNLISCFRADGYGAREEPSPTLDGGGPGSCALPALSPSVCTAARVSWHPRARERQAPAPGTSPTSPGRHPSNDRPSCLHHRCPPSPDYSRHPSRLQTVGSRKVTLSPPCPQGLEQPSTTELSATKCPTRVLSCAAATDTCASGAPEMWLA